MMESGESSATVTRQTAAYLAEMADELAKTGTRSGLPFLAYLFSMAAAEARSIVKQRPRPAARVPARAVTAAAAAPLA